MCAGARCLSWQNPTGEPVSTNFAPVKNAKTILLTTYKRDGTPVPTPVSIAFGDGRAFFRSFDKAWKTKRLRNNPRVEVAASTLRGRPTGPPVQARATLLDGAQARVAAKALARRHRVLQGILVPAAHRLLRYRTMHYELSPDPGNGHPAG
jgi:PPOX class probable F420-dependent enzyme